MENTQKNPQTLEKFTPIRLVRTNTITRKGYYETEIAAIQHKHNKGRSIIVAEFVVTKGKCTGFKLTAGFYYKEIKGKTRLTYLCSAVGITETLSDPNHLLHKKLRVRVIPKTTQRNGKKYWNHIITRFHKLS